jgi:predicted negative regulator of RcsB-dependent stress response
MSVNDVIEMIVGMMIGLVVVFGINAWAKATVDKIPQWKINQIFDAFFDKKTIHKK